VREGQVIPPNALVVGTPARVVGEATAEQRERVRHGVASYLAQQRRHAAGEVPRHRGGDRGGA